jgi:pilus assembly protein TadC
MQSWGSKMDFKIPLTFSNIEKLKKKSPMNFFAKGKKKTKLQEYLDHADCGLNSAEYMSIVTRSTFSYMLATYIIAAVILFFLRINKFYLIAIPLALLFALFTFTLQYLYPKLYNSRKQRNIENNLLHALNDMHVQMSSGIPLFSILVNISSSDYGELSSEFKKAVKKINAGMPEIEVLEELGERNPSMFFRRTLWQISNGMRAGSDISVIIKESINSLNEEQLIQIQRYGNKLNPMIMFYMLISVIVPALSITFLTVIASLINLGEQTTRSLFIGLLFIIVIMQILFLGVIKSLRPSLI